MAVGLALPVSAWRFCDFRWRLTFLAATPRTDLLLDGLLWRCSAAILVRGARCRALLQWLARPGSWWVEVAAFIAVTAVRVPLRPMWQGLFITAMVVGTVLRPDHFASRLLETGMARWVGRLSYSLYVWQQLFLVSEQTAFLPKMYWLQSLPLNIGATFAVAIASYYLLEKLAVRTGRWLADPVTEGRRP